MKRDTAVRALAATITGLIVVSVPALARAQQAQQARHAAGWRPGPFRWCVAPPPPTPAPTVTVTATTTATPKPGPTVTVTAAPSANPTPTPSASTVAPQTVGQVYGGFSGDGDSPYLTADQLAAQDAQIAASGATWLRVGAPWSVVEATQGTYDWSLSDKVVAAAHAAGLKMLMVLAYSPSWATDSGDDKAPPTSQQSLAAWASFTRAAAARYGQSGVTAFEVWNEPNISPFWTGGPNVAQYVAVLEAAAAGIRAAQPSATIVTGGLSPAGDDGTDIAPLTFVQQMYADGAGPYFTAVAVHPYTFPAVPGDPSAASWSLFARVPSIEQVMAQNGDAGKKIWFTEFGAPTGTSSQAVNPQTQAQSITAAYAQIVKWPYAGPLFVYELQDAGTDPSSVGNNFGLLTNSGAQKPAWAAMTAAMAQPVGG